LIEVSCLCAWALKVSWLCFLSIWSLLLACLSIYNQILHLVNSPWKCKGDKTTSILWKEPVQFAYVLLLLFSLCLSFRCIRSWTSSSEAVPFASDHKCSCVFEKTKKSKTQFNPPLLVFFSPSKDPIGEDESVVNFLFILSFFV